MNGGSPEAPDFVGLAETILRALDASGIGMSITAQIGGRLERLYFNSAGARILGYPEEELADTPPMLPVAEDRRAELMELYSRWQQGLPIPDLVETELVRKDGTRVSVEVGLAWSEYDGHPATVAFIRDISDRRRAERERKRMEAELLQADRMATVGTLAAGVAHEINNPLTYLLLNMAHIRKQLEKRDDAEPLLGLIDSATEGGERVKEIVKDLLAFTRPHRSEVGPVDVEDTLRAAVKLADNALRHRARVETDFRPVPLARAIPARLGQVCLNLLVNAAQAFEDDSIEQNVVRVRLHSPSADEVVVEVEDNGVGIGADALERVFDPFYSTKPVGEGTGLGLAITRAIVDSLGGRVSIHSHEGEGTTVTVCLPAASPRESRTIRPTSPREESAEPARGRVLVVDDEPMVGRAICGLLEPPLQAEHVVSGELALDRLGAEPAIDVVLCDLVMPGMSGMDLYQRVCTEQPRLARRFVFITGGAFTRGSAAFVERAEQPVLRKPLDEDELRSTVLSVLAPSE